MQFRMEYCREFRMEFGMEGSMEILMDSVWNFVRYDSLSFFRFFGVGASGFFLLFCIFHTMPVWNFCFLLCALVASFFPYIFSKLFSSWLLAPCFALLAAHTARNFP